MKFLVLALCVCAASAATTFGRQVEPTKVQYTKPYEVPSSVQFGRTFGQVSGQKTFGQVFPSQVQFGKTVEKVVPVVRTVEPVVPVVPVVSTFKKYDGVTPVVKGSYSSDFEAPILRSESDVKPDGFNYVYETGNGIAAEANGQLKHVDDIDVVEVRGAYRYVSPDGTPVVVNYVADENGYQPQSDLLPVAPPVPVAIARALEWIAAQPKPVEVVKKF